MTDEEQRYMNENPLCELRLKHMLETLQGIKPLNLWAEVTARTLITVEQQRRAVRSEDVQRAIEDITQNIKPVVGGKSLDLAILALEAYQPWISVEDRLPEDWTMVLVYISGEYWVMQLATDENGTKYWRDLCDYNRTDFNLVTHWMPLPQPPKGEN